MMAGSGRFINRLRQGRLSLLALLWCLAATSAVAQSQPATPATTNAPFDVLDYEAEIEPDIAHKTVRGKVLVHFKAGAGRLSRIELDCGQLTIDAVRERGAAQKFEQHERRLSVQLQSPAKAYEERAIEIEYHGAPTRGIRFFPERAGLYGLFHEPVDALRGCAGG
ncbi:MAG TPA: hypothetical protein VGB17_08695 [Pyrinomonadaceae bacterium]|jgi:hypothetical protein